MIYDIDHRTTYKYAQPVSISHHLLHMCPRPTAGQNVERHNLFIEPAATVIRDSVDYFGNTATHVTIEESHAELSIVSRSTVDVFGAPPVEPWTSPPWETVADLLSRAADAEALDAAQCLYDSPMTMAGQRVRDYAAASFAPGRPVLEVALDLMGRIYSDFKFDDSVTDVATPVDTVFEERGGVCQDFAHLQIACLRAHGIAARYVSGYILTHPPEGKERLVGADASHAWLSVWSPGYGWMDVDPTNNHVPTTEHVTVAWGRDYGDVSPINGMVVGGGEHEVEVAVDMRPLG